jgi:3-deoxy-D-manno-octulosonic-acid transferase
MFFLAYNIVSIFLLAPVIFYHLYRSISRGRPPALAERFGFIPAYELIKIGGRPVIWLHAVSVGESIAARPLLKAMRSRYPDHAIVVSNTTETGREIASAFPEKDLCIYFPFDFLPAVKLVLNSVRPDIIIIMETEIWPNFTREASHRNIPVLLANGRISDRSFERYMKMNWFFRHPLQLFSKLCMQTDTDRKRIIAIGASEISTVTAGNLKYDIPLQQRNDFEKDKLRSEYCIPDSLAVFTAGSTHPGEEEFIINAFQELISSGKELVLILVPRHPERAAAVAALLEQNGLTYRRRTALQPASDGRLKNGQVLLVDTIGEMMNFYALSDLIFVGGSLVPTGGHNLLEPASVGVVSIFGPHMSNFREIASLTLSYSAGIQIGKPEELSSACSKLMDNSHIRLELGQNGLRMMRENGGATKKHLDIVDQYLC